MSTGPRAATACFTAAHDRAFVGDVGDHVALCLPRGDGLPQRRFLAPEHGDARARAGQRGRNGAADAAPAAGHESVSPVENCHAAASGIARFSGLQITLSFKFLAFKQFATACGKII
jgi:hypothetical protein